MDLWLAGRMPLAACSRLFFSEALVSPFPQWENEGDCFTLREVHVTPRRDLMCASVV